MNIVWKNYSVLFVSTSSRIEGRALSLTYLLGTIFHTCEYTDTVVRNIWFDRLGSFG